MPSTTNYEFGDVVLVPFPFADLPTTKKRPAVVISSSAYNQQRQDVIFLAISSQVHKPLAFGENLAAEWQYAGLLKVSVFKPLIATIERTKVLQVLGQLAERDVMNLHAVLDNILNLAK